MAKKEIPIEQLKIGMYVVELNVSWFKTPFFSHSILIDDELQIVTIKNCGATVVTIDTEKGVQPDDQCQQTGNKVDTPKEEEIKPTSLGDEMKIAKHLKESTKKMLRVLYSMVKDGGIPKAEIVLPFIDQTIDSLSRNSNAIINLFFSRNQVGKLCNHSFNMMGMSLLMAKKLGYSNEEQKMVGLAALLMDIGWIKIPDRLFSFQSPYTDDEFLLVKKHIDYSLMIIEKGDFDPAVHQAIAQHHERYDGSGYPAGLGGEQIHPMSRVLSIIDHFCAVTNGYYDRSPMIPARVLQEIYKKSLLPSHEPSLVQLLVRLVGIFPPSSAVLLNTGERAIVTQVNWRTPLAPKVKIYYNKKLMPLLRPLELDLSKPGSDSIVREIKSLIDLTVAGQDPAGLLAIKE